MSQDGYKQFFNKATEARREGSETEVKDRVQFRTRPKAQPKAPAAKSAAMSHEERLRFAMKVKPQRKRPPFPLKSAIGLGLTIVAVAGYLVYPDSFDKMFSHFEFRAFGEAQAESAPLKKPAESAKAADADKEKAAAKDEKAGLAKGSEADKPVSEDLKQFASLKQRKEELDARERELNGLEEELQKQKVELDKRITQLEEMRTQIGKQLKDRVDVDQEKVNKLVDLYSNMKAKQAADILANLNEELAVEVLAKMKKKNAAEVMNLLTPEKARILSEKYTGYRRIGSTQDPNKG